MTYSEIFEDAKMECGINVPQLWLTPAFGLLWMTEAVQKYQAEIGVARCTEQITLDTNSTDGKYKLNCSVGSVEEATIQPLGSTAPQYEQLVRLELDAFHQIIEQWPDQNQPVPDNWWIPNLYLNTNLNYCAIVGNTLNIYPYTIGGTVTLRYKPLLPPYSASERTDWLGWGSDPSSRMKIYGPREEFIPALSGIKAYVKKKITEMRPNGLKDYAAQYQIWNREFEEAKVFLRRRNTAYQQDTFQVSSMGGLI